VYWAQGVGAWGKVDGDGNAADVSRRLGAVFTGLDQRFGDWRVGLAGGYSNSSLNVDARLSSANVDTAHIGTYGGTSFGAWNFRSGGSLSFSTVATNRSIMFPGFADVETTRYRAVTDQAFGELGYGMQFANIAFEPFGGLTWVRVHTDGFAEFGGPAALLGSTATENVGYSSLGLRVATVYMLGNGMAVTPRALVAWQHAFGDVVPAASLAFAAGGTPFTISGVPIARDAAFVEAGFDMRIAPRVTLGIAYAGELATNAQDHSVKGTFMWKF
jgi:outer membrane autotransporter protein